MSREEMLAFFESYRAAFNRLDGDAVAHQEDLAEMKPHAAE
jgi:hypothetical protein